MATADAQSFEGITAIQQVLFMIIEMHVLGFAAKRSELLGRSAEEGLAAYVYTIGLPSLLFVQIANVSFNDVDFILVVSVLIGKALLCVIGVMLAKLVTRSEDGTGFAATLGGITMLLSTMSDDMGIGLPVFAPFFAKDASGASALADAPGKPSAKVELSEVVFSVIKGFRKNMLVLSVVIGGSYNVLSGGADLPWAFKQLAETAGQAFRPLVLLLGGMPLSESIGHLTSLRLAVFPTILVVFKSVLLPIICTQVHRVVLALTLGIAPTPLARDFVFVYGILPVATSSLAIVRAYNVDAELLASVASALLLGKVVAFALLVSAAYVVTFGFISNYLQVAAAALSHAMHSLSIAGGAYMLICAAIYPARRAPHLWTSLGLVALQTAYSLVFLSLHVTVLSTVEARIKMPPSIFATIFTVISTLRWSCVTWIAVMIIDQWRRISRMRDDAGRRLPELPRLAHRTVDCADGGAGPSPLRKHHSRHPDPTRRRPSTQQLVDAYVDHDSSAALGGTPFWVYVLASLLISTGMTVPFLPIAHLNEPLPYWRPYKGQYPIDEALWVPYGEISSQMPVYVVVYIIIAVLLAVLLAHVLRVARDLPVCTAQGADDTVSSSDADVIDEVDEDSAQAAGEGRQELRTRRSSEGGHHSSPLPSRAKTSRARGDSALGPSPASSRSLPPIPVSDSFVKPTGEVTLHVRLQLLGVLLLVRCICQAATLLAMQYNGAGKNEVELRNYTADPSVQELIDAEGMFSRWRERPAFLQGVESLTAVSLLTFIWIVLEDGQAFVTFLLLAFYTPYMTERQSPRAQSPNKRPSRTPRPRPNYHAGGVCNFSYDR